MFFLRHTKSKWRNKSAKNWDKQFSQGKGWPRGANWLFHQAEWVLPEYQERTQLADSHTKRWANQDQELHAQIPRHGQGESNQPTEDIGPEEWDTGFEVQIGRVHVRDRRVQAEAGKLPE